MAKHVCQHCSRPIEKRDYESENRFRSRKYCSQKCSKAYMKKHKVGWFKTGGPRKKTKDNLDYTWMSGRNVPDEKY